MRKTALILAGAAAFDLGVMAVAAQAQQAQGSPTSGPTTTGQAPAGIRGGFIIPLVAGRARSETTGDQSPEATRATDGHKIEGVAGVRACSPGAAGPCRDPAPFDPSAPAVPAAAQRSATTDLYMKTSGNLRYLKIDNTHTARTCIAQRGEVIMREGVQQCALPADAGFDRVGPSRR